MLGKGMTSPVHARQRGLVAWAAKCVGAGTSAPTGLEGDAESVTRSGEGVYVLTFPGDTSLDVRGVHVSISQAGTSDLYATHTYDEDARTVTVTVKDATDGTAFSEADLSSSETLHVIVWHKVASS